MQGWSVRRKRRILLVDDAPTALRATSTIERSVRDAEIETTPDPQRALAMHQTTPFDVIVCDHHMPTVNGLELCIRARIADPTVGLVLATAGAELPLTLAGLGAAGVDALARKPVEPASFGHLLGYVLFTPSHLRAKVRESGALFVPGATTTPFDPTRGSLQHALAFEERLEDETLRLVFAGARRRMEAQLARRGGEDEAGPGLA